MRDNQEYLLEEWLSTKARLIKWDSQSEGNNFNTPPENNGLLVNEIAANQ